MITRLVTDAIPEYPNAVVRFDRRGGTFTADEAHPAIGPLSVTTDDNGSYSIALWPNAEGLSATYYLAVYPGNDTIRFVLPAGDVPITMSELRAAAAWDWGGDATPSAIDLERARYANAVNPALGSNLIGHVHVDGSATTVRARLIDIDTFGADVKKSVATGERSTIRAGHQRIVYGVFRLDGVLTIDGELIIL